jgi:hypothetical protein
LAGRKATRTQHHHLLQPMVQISRQYEIQDCIPYI